MSGYAKRRSKERIAALAGRGMDLVSFWQECTEALAPAVPHYLGPCWFTLDPVSLLVTSHFQEGLADIPHEWLAQQYYADDYNKMADVARSGPGVATLHEATWGVPSLSARYRDVMAPYGTGPVPGEGHCPVRCRRRRLRVGDRPVSGRGRTARAARGGHRP